MQAIDREAASANDIIETILAGVPPTQVFEDYALNRLQEGDYEGVKRAALAHPDSFYCKALGFLAGVPGAVAKRPDALPTLLLEAANAMAEEHKLRFRRDLCGRISGLLERS